MMHARIEISITKRVYAAIDYITVAPYHHSLVSYYPQHDIARFA
jgi:hypothetical protein